MAEIAHHLIPLEKWAEQQYGEHAPSIYTLRRWARDGKIRPVPKKHGRTYFVRADAAYVDHSSELVERLRVAAQA